MNINLFDPTTREGLEIIGCQIDTYGHFEIYSIPYSNGKSLQNERDVTISEFFDLVVSYYHDKNLCNLSYGDDPKDQWANKKFILDLINQQKRQDKFL